MKTLSETNPYLQNKETAKALNARSTRTSCGVEGIVAKSSFQVCINLDAAKTKAVYFRIKNRLNQDSDTLSSSKKISRINP